MKLISVLLFSIILSFSGCITDDPYVDPRPPLMDDSDFSDFEEPTIATNDINTNISVVVSESN